MSLRDTFIAGVAALIATPVVLGSLSLAFAAVMGSTNYRIQNDSINFGGGLSSSTNYTMESTAGEIATGESSSSNFNLSAGYQQMITHFISLSGAAPITMSPTIPGVTGGTANGSTTLTVTTDNVAGYELQIASENTPAMVSGVNTIDDYVPGGNPDFSFGVGAGDAVFGYSPSGVDVVQRFLDNGASCGTGSSDTLEACWDGLSTTPETIARGTSGNSPSGADTTIYFRVGIGGSVNQPAGIYTATTTITALTL